MLKAEGVIVPGVQLCALELRRRDANDRRGFLIEDLNPVIKGVFGCFPPRQSYSSDTVRGLSRDEHDWHIHPQPGLSDRWAQTDTWWFRGKAVAAVAHPETKQLNLFQIGVGWGEQGNYLLHIPSRLYHCFLSCGGVINEFGMDVAIIRNYPSKQYPRDGGAIRKIEGRVPHMGSGVFINGREFNWDEVRDNLGVSSYR